MELGMVGLGRMGGNMARRLIEAGHKVFVYDPAKAQIEAVAADGGLAANSLDIMIKRLKAPRVIWVMAPAGEPTESTLKSLGEKLSAGDIIIDGGNSFYKDSVRRGKALADPAA